ncbi:MAG TPA: PAS domain-containing protein, partial [Crinalium sp.]
MSASRQYLDHLPAIALRIYKCSSLEGIVKTVVEDVQRLLNVDRALIYRFQANCGGKIIAESVQDGSCSIQDLDKKNVCFNDHLIHPYWQGGIRAIEQVETSDIEPHHKAMLKQLQVQSKLVIPIFYTAQIKLPFALPTNDGDETSSSEQLWGLLILHQCSNVRHWNHLEISLLRQLVVHMAIAMQKAKVQVFSSWLLESSMDGIMAFDRDGRYIVWNQAMEQIFGISQAEALGQRAFDLFPFLQETGENIFFKAALDGETSVAKDRPYRVPQSGREGFFEAYYCPLMEDFGEIIGGMAVVRDITARKQA